MQEIYYDIRKTKPVTGYEIDLDGYAILEAGIFYVYGNSKVIAFGNSKVIAFGNSEVIANDDSEVIAFGNLKVERRI